MNTPSAKDHITHALKAFRDGTLVNNARNLLNILGYRSERAITLEPNTAEEFVANFDLSNRMNRERAQLGKWKSIDLLFQLTDAEITLDDAPEIDFGSAGVEAELYQSYLFFALKLRGEVYTRAQLSQITREINKLTAMPAMVVFQYGQTLTLAVIDRRPHRGDESKDVLEKVTLIKDIDVDNPHRAHIDILFDLSLAELHRQHQFSDFLGLHQAWRETLDTEALNRQFYQRLFNWFEWAVSEGKFPATETKTLSPQEHVIRLITRLLFVWFIKEKGLVSAELFDDTRIRALLQDDNLNDGDSYYRAVLQNLFFATLNTEIERRGFSAESIATHRDFSRYRYKSQISAPDKLLALLAQTPFINGGLFDCLDSEEATGGRGYRVDCFSDGHYAKLSIPDRLFFDETRGLFPLLRHYKFTVEENTPIEQEVALDPELLGKVFENLLAAYNPETGATARKQTGSYYTPRPIVDYMVDEALVAALSQECGLTEDRLRPLLDYAQAPDDAEKSFDSRETDKIVRAISELKILDPAVGSGAFPMGALHKLTLALRRLDPDNKRWEQLQKERAIQRAEAAFDTKDDDVRREELVEINETFKRYRDSDFGRKLYLIQNSIFGADIQSIACQIAKLRFFISLTIEQAPDKGAENFGIKPLPNLETRFIAANTLIGLKGEQTLTSDKARDLERELRDNRERYFHATTRQQKLACKRRDETLRGKLAAELKQIGMPADEAEKIAYWDPYDQNASTDFFDAELMFGVTDGFDVAIGNPPYVEARNSLLSDERKTAYGNQVMSDWQESLPRGSDLLIYFYACSAKFLHGTGYGCFITQNAWLNTDYGHKFQEFSLNKFSFVKIVDTSAKFFSDIRSQNINAIITVFTRKSVENIEYGIADADMVIDNKRFIRARQSMKWGNIVSMPEFYAEILSKISPDSHITDKISFGQGLNFPLRQLSNNDSDLPIIVKSAQFVSVSVDGKISEGLAGHRKKKNKIPALVMPRGVGQRHYCIFNSHRAFSYSHVELYLPDDLWNSDAHYCLWLYLNSSFVWLFREITGRKNLGGGLLKAEATDMKMLPIAFDFDFSADARRIFHALKNRAPLPVTEEVGTKEHLLIDDIIADHFGFRGLEERIKNALLEQVSFRISRAQIPK